MLSFLHNVLVQCASPFHGKPVMAAWMNHYTNVSLKVYYKKSSHWQYALGAWCWKP